MSETVVITGGQGFVGRYLSAALAQRWPDWTIVSCGGPSDAGEALDVSDAAAVDALIARTRPTIVVHLAAVSAVTVALLDPGQAWQINLWGTFNLTRALEAHAPYSHLLFVSSAEVYGRSLRRTTPIDESALLEPANPYAVTKAAADLLVRQYAHGGRSASVARPFNHTGAGQSDAFALPSFANQIARIEAGLQPPVMMVGSLDDERDFLDVRDVVAAYVAMIEQRATLPTGAVMNVASGQGRRIGDLLERLLGMANTKIELRVDESRLRPNGIPRVVGDATQIRQALGWWPTHDFDETLKDILEEKRLSLRG